MRKGILVVGLLVLLCAGAHWECRNGVCVLVPDNPPAPKAESTPAAEAPAAPAKSAVSWNVYSSTRAPLLGFRRYEVQLGGSVYTVDVPRRCLFPRFRARLAARRAARGW